MPAGGYRLVWTPMVNGQRTCQYEHRFVMENHLGRRLRSDEHVHHINGDRRDNRLENLEIIDAVTHGRLHSRPGISRKPELRARIVTLHEQGCSHTEIARRVDLAQSTVTRHLQAEAGNPRRRWRKAGQ